MHRICALGEWNDRPGARYNPALPGIP